MKIWIVKGNWPGGLITSIGAFVDEEKARYFAGQQVGKDQGLISLETVEVDETRMTATVAPP